MKNLYVFILLFATQFTFAQIRFQEIPDPANYPKIVASQTITADISYQGYDETQPYFGEGEYEIFPDVVDGILDKPIIILDGFDPGDTRDIGGLYASLSFGGQNIADILRAEGFDIVVLNAPEYTTGGKDIDGGADYIQRNAMVFVALIQQINAQKVGDEKLVVLGPSMGGLIARYGLSYMDANSLDAQTRLYISFDAPHRGANIPISLQYVLNYFAESLGDPTAQDVVSQLLNSPAAKEMLVDHLLGHLMAGSTFEQDPAKKLPIGAPGFRDAFQSELDNLGFPSNVRNVAMINGSGNGTTNGTPGATIVNTNLMVDTTTDVDVDLHFTPVAGQTITVADATLNLFGIPISTFTATSQSPANTDGVDAAPGGTGSISDALDGGAGNQILIDFIAALQQDTYSFIPTMSSLAIDNPNWFAVPNLSDSPFVNIYIQNENQPHVTVTDESAQFALDEIRNGALATTDIQFGNNFVLSQNPVKNTIKIALPANRNGNITTSVYTLTGQKVMAKEWLNPTNQILWNQNLSSGFYLLKISNGINTQTIKMIIE